VRERERAMHNSRNVCEREHTGGRETEREKERERTIRGTYCNGGGALSLTIIILFFFLNF